MCGLTGVFGDSSAVARLGAATDAIAHRGPDASGVWRSPDGTSGLGHRRLSIIDLSSAGDQPIVSSDGRVQLVFNGEIYNYRELRSQLPRYDYRSRTDSEVLLAAYL